MTGVVWKVVAPPGTRVTAGSPVVIMESMKMEIPVETPADGTVTEVHVAADDQVENGTVLMVVAPADGEQDG